MFTRNTPRDSQIFYTVNRTAGTVFTLQLRRFWLQEPKCLVTSPNRPPDLIILRLQPRRPRHGTGGAGCWRGDVGGKRVAPTWPGKHSPEACWSGGSLRTRVGTSLGSRFLRREPKTGPPDQFPVKSKVVNRLQVDKE